MIIRQATILDLGALSIRERTDVRLEGNRVAAVGTGLPAAEGASPPEEETIDASGMYLISGLVNTHAHTAMTLLRGASEDLNELEWFNEHVWVYERNLEPEDVYIGTLLGAAEMLLGGVTWVADHYFAMDRAWQAYQEAGLRADLAWTSFGTGEGWEARHEQALGFAKEFRGRDPRLSASLGPHSAYLCPPAFLERVAREAEELGLRLHLHVSETGEQVENSVAERGLTPVEVLRDAEVLRPGTLLAHAYYATDEDLALIAQRGCGVAHCAKTYLKFGDVHDFLPRALEAGVAVGLGTDGPASNNTLSIFEAARCAALLAKSAWDDATAAPVAAVLPLLHTGGRILGEPGYGRVEPGSLADLVLIDPRTPNMMPGIDPFADLLYSLGEHNVHTVIVDGRVVVREGRLLTVDLPKLYEEARRRVGRLTRKVPGGPMQRYAGS
jgi:5-methylthioadenosine/S-adenosylhomocysteine deaminase